MRLGSVLPANLTGAHRRIRRGARDKVKSWMAEAGGMTATMTVGAGDQVYFDFDSAGEEPERRSSDPQW